MTKEEIITLAETLTALDREDCDDNIKKLMALYNQAVDDCANSAKVEEIVECNDQPSSSFGDDITYIVNKQSILKNKIV